MITEIVVALIGVVPLTAAILTIAVIVLRYRQTIHERLSSQISNTDNRGFENTLVKEKLDQAVSVRRVIKVSEQDKMSVVRRTRHVLSVFQGAQILWVDDSPEEKRSLRRILGSLGTYIDTARNTDEAQTMLQKYEYDLVISDIKRGQNEAAGIEMVQTFREKEIETCIIFYVSALKPGVPEYVFNITNRPDHLLHFVMDILERKRWS